jgi:hypothetical protein
MFQFLFILVYSSFFSITNELFIYFMSVVYFHLIVVSNDELFNSGIYWV